jgi:hypothetical protein
MRKPNDTKRPNTRGSVEDKERLGNLVYLWVSKQLIWVPVLDNKGEDTGMRRQEQMTKGTTAYLEYDGTYTDFAKALKARADNRRVFEAVDLGF